MGTPKTQQKFSHLCIISSLPKIPGFQKRMDYYFIFTSTVFLYITFSPIYTLIIFFFFPTKVDAQQRDSAKILWLMPCRDLLIPWKECQNKRYSKVCCCCYYVASVVSDSVRPHRRQPTRLRRPWDSPGKNTGVGCHFLLQCMKVKSESEVTQSCPTLSDPMECSLPGSSVHVIFQARVLEWVAIAFSDSKVWRDSNCLKSI